MGSQGKTAYQTYLEDHLHRMHHEIEVTTRKLELEKRRLNKLDEDVKRARLEYDDKVMPKKAKKDIKDKYKEALAETVDPKKQVHPMQVKKLEHRLAKVISELNVLNHGNKEARDKIDQIRRERLQMNQVFKKLQDDIKENIHFIKNITLETEEVRDKNKEANEKMDGLKKKLEVERKNFKGSVSQLQNDMKSQETEKKEMEVRLFKETYSKTKGFIVAPEEDEFSDSGFMKRILKLAFLNTIQRRHIKQHQKNIEVFEQAFATIKSTTGISDIEEIVKIFVKLEERNFSLLTYVNTLNREIESLEKRNRELSEQIKAQKELEKEGEARRKEKLEELKAQIQSTIVVTDENMHSFEQHAEVLEKCKPLILGISKTVEKENRGFGGQVPSENNDDNILSWLTYIERSLTQWRDFLPETKDTRHFKPFPYTVGAQVKMLPPKKHTHPPPQLLRQSDLPNATLSQEGAQGARGPVRPDGDSDSDEEDYGDHPWSRQELKDKTLASLAKRRKHKNRAEANAGAGVVATEDGAGDAQAGAGEGKSLDYDDMTRAEGHGGGEEGSNGSDSESDEDAAGPTDEEINEIFLKRYKMSKEELQQMAEKMGIQLNNLCYLKQEFDAYDEDRSGYIDVKELKELLEKLGEELSEDELEQAFKELDSDGSGEIEFFEFVEWFTSED
jgi:hypothetical protein